MTKPSWITTSKTSGSGNSTIDVTAQTYTGRTNRNGTITITGANGAGTKKVSVTQLGESEFIDMDSESPSVGKNDRICYITGISNAAKLKFSVLSRNELNATINDSYTAAGITATNNVAIQGDPGASSSYQFKFTVNIPETTNLFEDLYSEIQIESEGVTVNITILQSAASPTLEVSVTSLTLNASGDKQSFNIVSNTSWTIS